MAAKFNIYNAASITLFGAAFAVTPTARAEDSTAAGALFDQGVADMLAGRLEQGCPKLQESQRIDPRPGTLFTLAECEAKAGRVASAVSHYEEYLAVVSQLGVDRQARHRERVVTANAQLQKLKPTVPSLTLVLPPDSEPGTVVVRNGVQQPGTSLGMALAVDPGPYTVVTRTPAGVERVVNFNISVGEHKRVQLELPSQSSDPRSSPLPPAPSAPLHDSSAAQGSVASPVSTAPPELDSTPAESKGRKTLAYALGGAGIAGMAVGSITGILVFSKKSTVDDNCQGTSCNSTGLAAADSGKNLALVSNIAFGVGIAGLAAGAILLFTAPKERPVVAAGWQPLVGGDANGGWAGLRRNF